MDAVFAYRLWILWSSDFDQISNATFFEKWVVEFAVGVVGVDDDDDDDDDDGGGGGGWWWW